MNIDSKIRSIVDPFIEKWIPNHYAHLVDTDENDGEELRSKLKQLMNEFTESLIGEGEGWSRMEDGSMVAMLKSARNDLRSEMRERKEELLR